MTHSRPLSKQIFWFKLATGIIKTIDNNQYLGNLVNQEIQLDITALDTDDIKRFSMKLKSLVIEMRADSFNH